MALGPAPQTIWAFSFLQICGQQSRITDYHYQVVTNLNIYNDLKF
jgi:hypothetical protein